MSRQGLPADHHRQRAERHHPRSLAGFVAALALVLALAEGYLRWWPPNDLFPFLGDEAPLAGPFKPHPHFGLTYRSFAHFQEDYRLVLEEFGRLDRIVDPRPIWAFFGNSFIQADGMLAHQACRFLPAKRVFFLRRNENLEVRLAQIELLLANGMRPERIFIALLPVDMGGIGPQPLDTVLVNSRGAMTYRPRRVNRFIVDWLIDHSRIAFTAWVRSGKAVGNPSFNRRDLYDHIHPRILMDLRGMFGYLSQILRHSQVPATIILIPTWEQVVGTKNYSFQDVLGNLMRELGFDVYDPRSAFMAVAETLRPDLYIADKHLSQRGNMLLLQQLLQHLGADGTMAPALQGPP
jgi:hypothetical protein